MLSFNYIEITVNQWILLGLTGTITLIIFYVRWKLTYWERQGINGPKAKLPFAELLTGPIPICDILQKNYQQYGKIYGAYSGLTANLVVSDPELLRSICVKDFGCWSQGFVTPGYLDEVQRDSLVNLYGDPWKRMRSILSPTFSSGKIKKMFNLIKICNQDAQKALTSMTANGSADFDPKYFWGRYNLDVIAKCCFAANLDVYGDKDDTLLKRCMKIFHPDRYKIYLLMFLPKFLIRMFKITPADTENLNFFRDLTHALIEKREGDPETSKADDFLQLLIDLSDKDESDPNGEGKSTKLNLDEIVASSVVFLLAGYETTSTLLTWACYRLATNPEVQEKLFNEVSKVDISDYETLSTLPYLDAVINESLRIDPPLLLFQRHNHTDYIIPEKNVLLSKGTICTIPVYAIHHDPENYPNPETFDPERFISGSPPAPFTFLPFGAGPRTCIGMRFALINAKLSLASLVRSYQIITTEKTPGKVEIAPASIMLTAKSLPLGIRPRA